MSMTRTGSLLLLAACAALPAGAAEEQVVRAPPAPAAAQAAAPTAPPVEAKTCPTDTSGAPGVCAPDGSSVNTLEDIVRASAATARLALAPPGRADTAAVVWKPVKREPTARR